MKRRTQAKVTRPDPRDMTAMPWGFAQTYLGHTDNYGWVEQIMASVAGVPGANKATFTTALCNNESGKTTRVLAALAAWHAAVFKFSTTLVTAGVFRQVRQQLFPAIERLRSRVDFRGWDFKATEITAPPSWGSRIIGIRPVQADYFEGYHGSWNDPRQGPLMVMADEGKAIKREIYGAIEERCNPQRTLYVSSAGGPFGYFYDTHEKPSFKGLYERFKVTVDDCPHIPKESVERRIAKWGRNHPLVKGPLFSEWMLEIGDEFICPLSAYEHCLTNPPDWMRDGVVVAFCDFGQGTAENVFTLLNGNKAVQHCWKQEDEVKGCKEFVDLFVKYRLRPEQIGGDAGSRAFISILKNMGWPIRGVNNQAPARNPRDYANTGSQMWFDGAMAIRNRELLLPNDDVLKAQCTTRKQVMDGQGRLMAQPKDEMIEDDGLESPDRADSLFGALWMRGGRFDAPREAAESHEVYASKGFPFAGGRRRESDDYEHAHEPAIAGMDVGE